MANLKIVIVGGGAGGARVTAKARRVNESANLTLPLDLGEIRRLEYLGDLET